MSYVPIEEQRMYRRAEMLADAVGGIVGAWKPEIRRTVGEQLIRAADSVGANIAEAGGRYHSGEVRQFLFYARGSLRETVYWLRRVGARQLAPGASIGDLHEQLDRLARELNAAIAHQRKRATRVREEPAPYTTESFIPYDHGTPNPDAGHSPQPRTQPTN